MYDVMHYVAVLYMTNDNCQASNVGAGTHSAARQFFVLRQRMLPILETICLDIFISRLHDVINNWYPDVVNAQWYSSILLQIVNWS